MFGKDGVDILRKLRRSEARGWQAEEQSERLPLYSTARGFGGQVEQDPGAYAFRDIYRAMIVVCGTTGRRNEKSSRK